MLEKESQAGLSVLRGTNPSSNSMLKVSKDGPENLTSESHPLFGSHDSSHSNAVEKFITEKRKTQHSDTIDIRK